MTKVFIYDMLNVHDTQREVWGEAKEGKPGHTYDFELKALDTKPVIYAEAKPGECISGKAYSLTKEELEATDKYMTAFFKRISLPRKVGDTEDIYIYIKSEDDK